jgi:hypothetical protein
MATRRRIEEVRGATQLAICPEGAVSLPRDSSKTLALLFSRGLPCADRDDHAMRRPLVYRPTLRLLQLLGMQTLEEARMKMRVPAGPSRWRNLALLALPTPSSSCPLPEASASPMRARWRC